MIRLAVSISREQRWGREQYLDQLRSQRVLLCPIGKVVWYLHICHQGNNANDTILPTWIHFVCNKQQRGGSSALEFIVADADAPASEICRRLLESVRPLDNKRLRRPNTYQPILLRFLRSQYTPDFHLIILGCESCRLNELRSCLGKGAYPAQLQTGFGLLPSFSNDLIC